MAQGYGLLCPAEARKLLVLMAATVALVIVFQYLEFPSGRVFSSLFSARNMSTSLSKEPSTNPQMLDNNSSSNDISPIHETGNSSEALNVNKETSEGNESEEKEGSLNTDHVLESNGTSSNNFDLVSNGTTPDAYVEQKKISPLQNADNSVSRSVAYNAMPPDISIENASYGSLDGNLAFAPSALPPIDDFSNQSFPTDADLRSPIISLNLSTSSMIEDSAGALDKEGNSGLWPSNFSLSVSGVMSSRTPVAKGKKSKKPPSHVISISQMNNLLLKSRASSSSLRPKWPSQVDQELLFAKSQIQKAPGIGNDSRLYAPIYRNISMFKRSYELMESILKVYIYKEGEIPIFHKSILNGIYASEGWFLKLMENNEKFVTDDPKKAHLFYIPFSSRLLELTLYVPKSHSRKNLIEYMKNYVNMIAAKYSFWNRTGGTDHFLAACHDWAPAETRGRLLNSIRALCNADIDVGFSIGKDVSLPETYVLSAENPLKSLEGNPLSQRPILAFFAGNMHGYVRPILLKYWQNKEPDMKIFGPMPHVKGNTNYIQHMKSSKYCICPKGHEVNSPRIVEAIHYECVPVIISDNYVPPFFEVLDWESFAVFVSEKEIPNLKNILLSISEERYLELHKRVKKVQQHFLWHTNPVRYDLFHMILHSVWYNRVFQMRAA